MSMLSKLRKWSQTPQDYSGPSIVGLAKAAVSGALAPGDAYNEGMTREEMLKRGNDFAGSMAMGGLTVPRPRNSLGIFGGVKAKAANLDELAKAQKLEAAGASPDDIWRSTGWGKGKDGAWRFEIDDRGTGIREGSGIQGAREGYQHTAPLEQVYDHQRLFANYPELKELPFFKMESDKAATGTYYAPQKGWPKGLLGIDAGRRSNAQMNDTMLHELQHAVQGIEGFAKGGSPKNVMDDIIENLLAKNSPEAKRSIDKLERYKHSLHTPSPFIASRRLLNKLYRNLAGETEARLASKRSAYDPELRRQRTPWRDEDVERQSQIVLGNK